MKIESLHASPLKDAALPPGFSLAITRLFLTASQDAPVDLILTDSIISVERYLKTHYRQKTSKALI